MYVYHGQRHLYLPSPTLSKLTHLREEIEHETQREQRLALGDHVDLTAYQGEERVARRCKYLKIFEFPPWLRARKKLLHKLSEFWEVFEIVV